MKVHVEKKIGAQTLSFETGVIAKQADAAVIVRYGDTMVLCTATSGPPRPGPSSCLRMSARRSATPKRQEFALSSK